MKYILLMLGLVTMNIANAQDGFQYVTTGNGADYSVKIETSAESTYGLWSEFWLKYDNPQKRVKTKTGKYITTGGGYTLAYMNISCGGKTHKTNNIINYNKSGNVIGRDDIPTITKPIVLGSVIEAIYKSVCNKN